MKMTQKNQKIKRQWPDRFDLLLDRRVNDTWALLQMAREAYEAGLVSRTDYNFMKKRLNKAFNAFVKVKEHRCMPRDCSTCDHSRYSFVKVGDADYGNDMEDWDCDMMDRMTDEDVKASNEGHCPFWTKFDDSEMTE